MGFLSSISNAASSVYNKAADTVSSAADKVEQKVDQAEAKVEHFAKSEFEGAKATVTGAVDTVKAKVATAETKVTNFAKSEYGEAKNLVKLTGEKISNGASSVLKNVESVRLPQGISNAGSALWDKVTGGSTSKGTVVEGGDSKVANGGDPKQVVDLSSPAKRAEFLSTFGQKDLDDDTQSDGARCQSNVMVAGLLMKDGPEGLKKGLISARADAAEQLKTAKGGKKLALEGALKSFDSAIAGLDSGKVTRGQLDHAADALFNTMAPADVYNDKGETTTTGIADKTIGQMEKTVGLSDGEKGDEVGEYSVFNPAQLWTENNREVSNKTWEQIEPGKSAHVSVNLFGENIANKKGPQGEELITSSHGANSGQQYYVDKDTGNPVYVEKDINHAVLFGKNADGMRYIYNPIGDPPMTTEKPNDKASTEALDQMSAKLMGFKGHGTVTDDFHSRVAKYG